MSTLLSRKAAVAAMREAGAAFSVQRRDDSLAPTFTYRVDNGGNMNRCREILAEVKARPPAFFQAFRCEVSALLRKERARG